MAGMNSGNDGSSRLIKSGALRHFSAYIHRRIAKNGENVKINLVESIWTSNCYMIRYGSVKSNGGIKKRRSKEQMDIRSCLRIVYSTANAPTIRPPTTVNRLAVRGTDRVHGFMLPAAEEDCLQGKSQSATAHRSRKTWTYVRLDAADAAAFVATVYSLPAKEVTVPKPSVASVMALPPASVMTVTA